MKNLDARVHEGVIQVDAETAREYARLARKEGILAGISTNTTSAAITQKLAELSARAMVLGLNCDAGERYLSVEGFSPNDCRPCRRSGRLQRRHAFGGSDTVLGGNKPMLANLLGHTDDDNHGFLLDNHKPQRLP